MNLLEKELLVRQIQLEIKRNNTALLEGLLSMEKMRHNNTFLEEIYQDYKRFYDYIVNEKAKQKLQLEFLLEYLENSIEGKGLSQDMLNRAKFERKNILRSLSNIREDLNELTLKGRGVLEKCNK